jgi:hypothetical protein
MVGLKLSLKFKLAHIVNETRQIIYCEMRENPKLIQKQSCFSCDTAMCLANNVL